MVIDSMLGWNEFIRGFHVGQRVLMYGVLRHRAPP